MPFIEAGVAALAELEQLKQEVDEGDSSLIRRIDAIVANDARFRKELANWIEPFCAKLSTKQTSDLIKKNEEPLKRQNLGLILMLIRCGKIDAARDRVPDKAAFKAMIESSGSLPLLNLVGYYFSGIEETLLEFTPDTGTGDNESFDKQQADSGIVDVFGQRVVASSILRIYARLESKFLFFTRMVPVVEVRKGNDVIMISGQGLTPEDCAMWIAATGLMLENSHGKSKTTISVNGISGYSFE